MKKGRGMKTCLRLLLLVVVTGLLLACGGDDTDETAPVLTFVGTDPVTTTRSHLLAGTVESGATVEVTVDTTAVISNLQVVNDLWSCTVDSLAPGFNTVNVKATDSAGNQNTLAFALVYDALSIERFVTPIPGNATVIGGLIDPLAPASSLSTILSTSASAAPAVIVGDRWSVDLAGLAAGDNVVTLKLAYPDPAVLVERSVTINVNTTAPAPLVTIDHAPIDAPFPSDTINVGVGGTRGSGLTVAISAPTATATTPDLAVDGIWSSTLSDLDLGKNPFTVSATANGVTAIARDLVRRHDP